MSSKREIIFRIQKEIENPFPVLYSKVDYLKVPVHTVNTPFK